MASLTLGQLTKRFGRTLALDRVDLEVRDGEFFVLLGPTGAGKTTALRAIAGLERLDGGKVLIGGQDVTHWSTAQRDVALVFQYYSLYPHYTVRENLEFPLRSRVRNLSDADIRARVDRVAATLRIAHLLDRKTDKLSGGEMQRVSIGRAIVRDPRLFLMDEPLSNLDAKLREILRAELKSLQMNLGATFLYVTHDQVEAMTMGDRIGVLREGRLVQVGTPYDIYNRPCDTFVATFVGSPTMNLLSARLEDGRVRVADVLDLPLQPQRRSQLAAAPLDITVGIRSEDIRLDAGAGKGAKVYGVENHGMEKVVTVSLGGTLLRATLPARSEVAIDADIPIAFDVSKMHFFGREDGRNLLES